MIEKEDQIHNAYIKLKSNKEIAFEQAKNKGFPCELKNGVLYFYPTHSAQLI